MTGKPKGFATCCPQIELIKKQSNQGSKFRFKKKLFEDINRSADEMIIGDLVDLVNKWNK